MRPKRPHNYTKDIGPVDSTEQVTVRFILKGRNQEWLDKKLQEVSDPNSPEYGKYLSQEEINSVTGPEQDTFERVLNFVHSLGYTGEKNSAEVHVKTTAGEVPKLLGAELRRYTDPTTDEQHSVRKLANEHTLPAGVTNDVEFVAFE